MINVEFTNYINIKYNNVSSLNQNVYCNKMRLKILMCNSATHCTIKSHIS